MKVKKKRKKLRTEKPNPNCEWRGDIWHWCEWRKNVLYTNVGSKFAPDGWPTLKKSPQYPKESQYAQSIRYEYKLPDDVNVEKMLRKNNPKQQTWQGRTISEVQNMPRGYVFTLVSDKKRLVGRVVKVKEDRVVYRKYGEEDTGKFSLPLDTEVVHGNVYAVAEPSPMQYATILPKSDLGAPIVYADKKVKRDRFGAKMGSEAAKINAVIDTTPKTASKIRKESKTDRNVTSHLAKLVKLGKVKKWVGKKSGKTFYKEKV